MKKSVLIFSMLMMATFMVLASCSSANEVDKSDVDKFDVKHITDENAQDDFVFRLYSEKGVYEEGEAPEVYGELEYTGSDQKVTIEHAASPFVYSLEEKVRGYEIEGAMEEILASTELEKGKSYTKGYDKSGGYNEDSSEEIEKFKRDFLNRDDFPPGYYVINGSANFTTEDGEEFNIGATIDFKVIP